MSVCRRIDTTAYRFYGFVYADEVAFAADETMKMTANAVCVR